MAISRQTTFPPTPAMPGGNQITVTGVSGTDLKQKEIQVLQDRLTAQGAGSVVLQNAINDLNL